MVMGRRAATGDVAGQDAGRAVAQEREPPKGEAVAVNCDPPATAGTRVVPVCRQDGGSPYGYVPHRNRMRMVGWFCLRLSEGCGRMCCVGTASSVAVGREMPVGCLMREKESER